jgi:hypothetical protein
MHDNRPTEPPDDEGPEACPVCAAENVDAEGEYLLPSGHCSEFCVEHDGHGSYSWRDVEVARYVGEEDCGVYYSAGQGPKGWYYTTVVDSPGNMDYITTDDGPHDTEDAAWAAGKAAAMDWCFDNDVEDHDGLCGGSECVELSGANDCPVCCGRVPG